MGVVAFGGAVDLGVGEGQVVQFLRGQHAALEGLRQDAPGAGSDGRVLEQLGADLQLGLRQANLAGDAEFAVLVGHPAVVAYRQQTGTAATGRGVELEAEHADGIAAEAQGAQGVAGAEIEDETLGPFLALGDPGIFAEVAVEVEILGLQGGLAVVQEAGGMDLEGQGQQGKSRQDLVFVVHGWSVGPDRSPTFSVYVVYQGPIAAWVSTHLLRRESPSVDRIRADRCLARLL